MEFHEAANLFPMLTGAEFDELCADIAKGYDPQFPIITIDGKILDGRNRYAACLKTGTEPMFREYTGTDSPLVFVTRANLHRRHLSASQRAAFAVEALPMLEAEARKRQIELAGTRPNVGDLNEIFHEGTGQSSEQAASLFGTNMHYVHDAKRIAEEAPELLEQVKSGEMTIPQAKREMVKRERMEAPELPSSKYRVIYADPPWKYGNDGIINNDNYGHVGRHYPSMSIRELCDLPVKELANEDSVLFLWVTSPLLAECFDVITAWGFEYKTSFVWDKVKHNFGHYNSVRHEFLLICTRGSCTPDELTLFDSVQTIERTNSHSQKPEEFRSIIDKLYTRGSRIELFARETYPGWESWGNEPANN